MPTPDLPGLAQHEARMGRAPDPDAAEPAAPEAEAGPSPEALMKIIDSLNEQLAAARKDAAFWQGKFKNTDADVQRLQGENARLQGLIPVATK